MSSENDAKWYVLQTYSGYENKVLDSINKMIVNMGLQDKILEVKIPIEEVMEVKNDRRKVVQRKLFPGYVMIKMILTKQTIYLVRNTRGVTNFVGSGTPTPLTNDEVRRMGVENVRINIDIEPGDCVDVISGAIAGFQGIVQSVDTVHQKVRVLVTIFNRETTVELDVTQVKKVG